MTTAYNRMTARQGVPPGAQRGVALFTAMVLLFALTIAAITAMRSTTLDYRVTSNAAQRGHAFELSEGARRLAGNTIDAHVDERGWTGVGLPTGLTVTNAGNSDGLLYAADNAAIGDITSASKDFEYLSAGTGLTAEVFVSRLDQQLATGTGAATTEGYSGLGFGSAAGGGLLFFDIRSVGVASDGEARAVTGADFRHVIR